MGLVVDFDNHRCPARDRWPPTPDIVRASWQRSDVPLAETTPTPPNRLCGFGLALVTGGLHAVASGGRILGVAAHDRVRTSGSGGPGYCHARATAGADT